MQKKLLFTPGPTPVPERVMLAMARPMIHHRKPVFEGIFKQVEDDLKWLFQTKNDVLIFAATGTGAMEGAMTNFLSPGDKVITVDGGKFGQRWGGIAKAYGLNAVTLKVEWGKPVDPQAIKTALKENPDAKAVYVQASETSTATWHPIPEIAAIVKETPAILVVDAITALGVYDMPLDSWGVDICVSGSQKAFMLPPGLAFASISDKAWKLNETAKLPRYYFDWGKERKNVKKNTTAYTPAVSLVVGLAESLAMMKEEGLSNLFARHSKMAKATQEAMKALGLKLYSSSPANSVTGVCAPEGLDGSAIVKHLDKAYGVIVADGQDDAKGKMFRISHLGYYTPVDMLTCVAAIETALADFGVKFTHGAGVAKASEILAVGKS